MPAGPKPRAIRAKAALDPQPIRAAMRRHPVITWATAASIATVIAVAVPGGAWLFGHFQTVEAAERHERDSAQKYAAVLYGQQRIETLILRGRVNECRAKAVKPAACADYEQEYRAAAQRERALFEAMQRGK